MKKYLLPILIVSFWSCGDETETTDYSSEPIVGLWNWNTQTMESLNNPNTNYILPYDSITFDFKSDGSLIIVDSRQIKESEWDFNDYNGEGIWEPYIGSDSVSIDNGAYSEGRREYAYQIDMNNTLLIHRTVNADDESERIFKDHFTRN